MRTTPVLTMLLMLAFFANGATQQRPGFLGLGFTHHAVAGEQWLGVRIIVPGGPAQAAGIRVGDVVTAINGTPVRFGSVAEVMDFLAQIRPQQRVEVTTLRAGKTQRHVLTAIRMPDEYWERWQATLKVARQRAARERQ